MSLTAAPEDGKANSSNTQAENKSASLRPLYLRSIIGNFGNGVMGPYTTVYAVQLGASPTEMGWFRSLTNFFANVMQIPWGTISDRTTRRAPFIILGGVLSSLFWLPMIYVRTSHEFVVLVVAQAFIGSMVAPAWSALIGDLVPHSGRGSATASINAAASVGSIIATLISGYIMTIVGGSLAQMYTIPLILAAVCGFAASLTMLTLHEKRETKRREWGKWRTLLKGNPYYTTFCMITLFHSFFMAIAWPIFTITVVRVVKADTMQIAYLSVIQGCMALTVRRFVGRLVDRAGRKSFIVFGRSSIVIVPIIYAVATSVYHLYAVELVVGIVVAAVEIAVLAYLLDIVPEEQRAGSIALFNMFYGVAIFLGSLAGGYLADTAPTMGFGELASLQLVYGVSAVGRLAAGLSFARIKEPYRYPSTIREELARIMREDAERARKGLEQIEERGKTAQEDLEKDFEWFESILRWKEDKERR